MYFPVAWSIGILSGAVHAASIRTCVEKSIEAAYKAPSWIVSKHDPSAKSLKTALGMFFQETNHHHLNAYTNWMEHHFFTQMIFRNVTWAANVVRSPWTRWTETEARAILENLRNLHATLAEAGHPLKSRLKTMSLALDTEILAKGRFPLPGRASKMIKRALQASTEDKAIAALNRGLRSMPRRTYDFTPYYGVLNLIGAKNIATWSSQRTIRFPFRFVQSAAYWGLVGYPLIFLPIAKSFRERPNDHRFDRKSQDEIEAFNQSRKAFFDLVATTRAAFNQTDDGRKRLELEARYHGLKRVAELQGNDRSEVRAQAEAAKVAFQEVDLPYQVFFNVKIMSETLGIQIPDLVDPASTKPWDDLASTLAESMALPYEAIFGDFRSKYLGSLRTFVWPGEIPPVVHTIPEVLMDSRGFDLKGLTGATYFTRLKQVVYPMFLEELARVTDEVVIDMLPNHLNGSQRFEESVSILFDRRSPFENERLEVFRNTRIWRELAPRIHTEADPNAAIAKLKDALMYFAEWSHEHVQMTYLANGENTKAPTDFSSIEARVLSLIK